MSGLLPSPAAAQWTIASVATTYGTNLLCTCEHKQCLPLHCNFIYVYIGLIAYKIMMTRRGIAHTPLEKSGDSALKFATIIIIESAAAYLALMTIYVIFTRLDSPVTIVVGSAVSHFINISCRSLIELRLLSTSSSHLLLALYLPQ
jgi:hypothetical protein